MAPFYQWGLLLSCLLMVISNCRADSPLPVSASRGEDIAVPCVDSKVTRLKSCSRVRWIKYSTDAGQRKVLLFWLKEIQDPKQKAELFLTNLQKSDEGLYACEICHGWNCTQVKNISLRVKDCKVLAAVKVAPSRSTELNCPVDITLGQEGPQNISWALLKGGEPLSLNSDTSLVIKSASDSAWYRCTYIYRQTQRCFDIKMIVQAEDVEPIATKTQETPTMSETPTTKRTEESRATYIAVVASVIVGILVVAAVMGVFIHRNRNTRRHTQQTPGPPAGVNSAAVYDGYDTVTLPDDPQGNKCVNSLYQQIQDEGLSTFHY
ncbi:uncharacterized protein LOC118302798 isoform X1 [Scophthalmus maximus]|uniref:uncharacterized protein LOC118302798 isoform X1 n=1 Tax=Scophthalmus maximus TaxID=52904 RepID=UPI001FA900F2|nr:uncharacterized protein LOC118302798 isoform X1 [Scophthalmus maximus]